MDVKVSTKGNVMLPTSIRLRLGIKPGDELRDEGILLPRPASDFSEVPEDHLRKS